MTIITQQGTCKYCGEATSGYERDEANQRWITYNPDMSVHYRDECRANQAKKKNYQAKAQQVQKTQTQKYFQTKNETTATGININSVYFVVTKQFAELNKKIDELRANAVTKKEYQEQATIIDSVAQNVDILVKKIGYPEPRPALESEVRKKSSVFVECNKCGAKIERPLAWVTGAGNTFLCENCYNSPPDTAEAEEGTSKIVIREGKKYLVPNDKELERQMESDAQAMDDMYKQGKELGIYPKHTDLQDVKPEDWREPQNTTAQGVGGWILISEKSICHSCQNVFHNGYMRWGTKLCEKCKLDIEANNEFKKIQEEGEDSENENASINQIGLDNNSNDDIVDDI